MSNEYLNIIKAFCLVALTATFAELVFYATSETEPQQIIIVGKDRVTPSEKSK